MSRLVSSGVASFGRESFWGWEIWLDGIEGIEILILKGLQFAVCSLQFAAFLDEGVRLGKVGDSLAVPRCSAVQCSVAGCGRAKWEVENAMYVGGRCLVDGGIVNSLGFGFIDRAS
jgi:hypothetical protein